MDTIQKVLGEYDYNQLPTDDEILLSILTTLSIALIVVVLLIMLIVYSYTSLTLYKTAERLKHPKPWLAWIPFARIYLQLELGNMNPIFILLYLFPYLIGALSTIPYIGNIFIFLGTGLSTAIVIINIITFINISKRRGYDGELGLMMIAPFTGWILRGILAWGKKNTEN